MAKRKPTLQQVRNDLLVLAKDHGFVPEDGEDDPCLSEQLQGLYLRDDPYDEKRLVLEALLAVEDAIDWDN